MTSDSSGPQLTRDLLIEHFHTAGKPRSAWRLGAELERHVLGPDGLPLPYFGEPGVASLLRHLQDTNGWAPYTEGANTIALLRGQASVTLEPGGQVELSGAPFFTVAEVVAEAQSFAAELDAALAGTGYTQVALGFTPFAEVPDIPWVPKGRYRVMREHLAATGSLSHHMMKGTCATQATFDFSDEADCAAKVQLGTAIGPLTVALFANSPLASGKPAGFQSWRGHIWAHTDPARTGIPDAAEHFSFERWTDYLLDAPMMFYKHQGEWRPANGLPFRRWMLDGIDGQFPTWDDWDLHLTSVFPELRVKRAIEVRGADCVDTPLMGAFCALFTGLFYDDAARSEATALGEELLRTGTRAERFQIACRDGLAGELGGRRFADWGRDLVRIADAGLSRWAPADRHWLEPLAAQVERGVSPAADVLAAFERDPSPASVIAAGRIGR